jgi:hypothetical protein
MLPSLSVHHAVGQFSFEGECEYVVKTFVSHELGQLWCPESDVNCKFFAFQVSTFGEATMGDFNDDTEYLIRQSDNYFKPYR